MSAISLRKRNDAGIQRPDPRPETILPEMRTGKSGAQKSMIQPRDRNAQPRTKQSLRPNLSEMNPLDRIPIIMEIDIILTGNMKMLKWTSNCLEMTSSKQLELMANIRCTKSINPNF
jgi:hypothetical protein